MVKITQTKDVYVTVSELDIQNMGDFDLDKHQKHNSN